MNKALPKGWETVALEDVAEEVREYEKEPAGKGIERLVGLAHIDPEDLRIRRWGLVADGTTFTKVFKKGQVLFGRRRAYQKKIAIADFDGICSGDILVFQTKEGLLPELLPFLMQSENFYNYALDTSAGSLSPRTKWKHLAKFEFALPPLTEQKRIAEVLWAVENSIRKTEDTVGVTERYKRILMKHLFKYGSVSIKKSKQMKIKQTKIGLIPENWEAIRLKDIFDLKYGKGLRTNERRDKGEIPVYGSNGIIGYSDKYLITSPTLIIGRKGSCGVVQRTQSATWPIDTTFYIDSLKLEKVNLDFLYYSLTNANLSRYTIVTAVPGVNRDTLLNHLIGLPPLEEQKKISIILSNVDSSIIVEENLKESLEQLKKGLMQDLFTGRITG